MIQEYLETELTVELALPIAELACASFPSSRTIEERIAGMLAAEGNHSTAVTSGRRFVIWDGGKAIAHARTFIREVFVGGGRIPVLALASVCTDPSVRGQGFGAKVTVKAFEQIQLPEWPAVSLFQTPVPVFYEKLNCRVITNRFVNKLNQEDPEANPWRDDTVMIYPAEFDWPSGLVDMNGPDY